MLYNGLFAGYVNKEQQIIVEHWLTSNQQVRACILDVEDFEWAPGGGKCTRGSVKVTMEKKEIQAAESPETKVETAPLTLNDEVGSEEAVDDTVDSQNTADSQETVDDTVDSQETVDDTVDSQETVDDTADSPETVDDTVDSQATTDDEEEVP